MALFQRKPQTSTSLPLYTLGNRKTLLIVGLGNPGKKYDGTRHNIGFAVVDNFAAGNEFPAWTAKSALKCMLTQATLGESSVILAKPTTFMNLSGEAVRAIAHFYKIPASHIVVVHDELDIAFGQILTRVGGSSAGHNGLKSIIECIGADFGRVRIGIGPKIPAAIDSADFVLQKFSKIEKKQLSALRREASAVLSEFIFGASSLPADTRSFIV